MNVRLVNDLTQDPLLYASFDSSSESLLLDCGYMFGLSLREIQKISSIFVSHTHFDHFMGFDHMLRMRIEQNRDVEIFGPSGFIFQAAGKLSGYSWNLCSDLNLNFIVFEIDPPVIKKTVLKAQEAYKLGEIEILPYDAVLAKKNNFIVKTAIMDHIIPSLAFSIKEIDSLKVDGEALASIGAQPGPWLGELKRDALAGHDLNGEIEFSNGIVFERRKLAELLFYLKRGKKVSYIVDTVFSDDILEKAVELSENSDELYCECAFLAEDADKAASSHHLTASQAAIIAKEANVKKLFPIHLSKRYTGRFRDVFLEAHGVFPHVYLNGKGEFKV